METIKKLSHSHFLGAGLNAAKVAKAIEGTADKRFHIMRVAGMVLDTETVTTKYGESIALIGSFIATNPATGEQVKAAKCYLPDVAILPLSAAVKMGGSPQFAVDLFARLDEKSPVGFSYSLEELVESDADPVQRLMAESNKLKPLQLSAPAVAVEKTAAEIKAEAKKGK